MEQLTNNAMKEKTPLVDKIESDFKKKTEQYKNETGITGLSLPVLERVLGKDKTLDLVRKYKAESYARNRIHIPREEEIKLFQEHLDFNGKVSEFAQIKNMTSSKVWQILHKVAYYKLVIKKEALE